MTGPQPRRELRTAIRGDGVAARCCLHLLTKAGWNPALERTSRPRVPAILLSDAALSLMQDVFEKPDLFRAAHRITRRVVQWGRNAEPIALDHAAAVVSESELFAELEPPSGSSDGPGSRSDFTIFASRPLPPGPIEYRFGSRTAQAVKIRLRDARDSTSCWIESLEAGWLFLIPNCSDSGWLLAVGCSPETMLRRSALISGRIAGESEPSAEFPASPRILSPLSGPGWLACGTAGIAFDPICGDGTANAVREAILAAAVVKAISAGGDTEQLLGHYNARLVLGFYRHLAASLNFYRSGYAGGWWDVESAAFERGLEWCAAQVNGSIKFRYQLRGFDLESIDDNLP